MAERCHCGQAEGKGGDGGEGGSARNSGKNGRAYPRELSGMEGKLRGQTKMHF